MRLHEFFEDADGSFSAMRLAFIVFILLVATVWVFVAIKTLTIPALPDSVVGTVAALVIGKAGQKFGEKP
jgi:uncharacterized membrane-anchored protein